MGSAILVIFRYYKHCIPTHHFSLCRVSTQFLYFFEKKKKTIFFFFPATISYLTFIGHMHCWFFYTAAFSFQNQKPIYNFSFDRDFLRGLQALVCEELLRVTESPFDTPHCQQTLFFVGQFAAFAYLLIVFCSLFQLLLDFFVFLGL